MFGPFILRSLVGNPSFNLVNITSSVFVCILGWSVTMFCIVFHVRKATVICVSLKSSVIIFICLPISVNVAHVMFMLVWVSRAYVYIIFIVM
jgi:hypothetical protein